ncbi:MAG: fibronectin type III domain-containing protein, partial [Bacteroidales bacterium]
MDSTRIKIGQVLYGQKEGSEDVALVKVESVGVGGINYNDTDNSFQYSFDELFGIPVAANVLLSSGFTLSNGLYVNDNISFIKIKQINGQWFWYADKDKCIMVKYLHELQGLYGDLTGNTLAVDEDALLIALDSPMVLSAPEGFATSAMTPNTVTITWDEDADAEGYSYQIDDGDWVEVLEAVAELTGLTYSTPYKIRVKAIGDGEDFVDSPESEEFSFTTDPLIVLDAPANLTATEVGVNEITITWGEVANATEYEVQIGDTTDTTDLLIYQFTSLDADTGYNISVKAVG